MRIATDGVIVVGAGPVGLTVAWLLDRAGVPVTVFEAEDGITDQLRASTFHPPTLDLFDGSGITAHLISHGRITPRWQIRMLATGEKAEFDLSVLAGDTAHPYRLQCRQAELSRALVARLPADRVRFSSAVVHIDADADGVTVATSDGTQRAALVIGCDGARSMVRSAMGVDFAGTTYPEETLLVTTRFPFQDHIHDLSGVNYIWSDADTFSLLRLPDLWRISLHPPQDMPADAALKPDAIRAQVAGLMPWAADLDIVESRVYRVHRRIADTYRAGRLFLAGDAAHLNSPKGGMGMNGGIHDAWALAERIVAVANGADAACLDSYDATRRPIARDDILAQADDNRARMNDRDPAARRARLRDLQAIAADPDRARAFLRRSSMIDGLARAEALA
jgi:2-polyprenyl-6-methoxyphenol hydroxylase-like FAD-dependent oxidoreductase